MVDTSIKGKSKILLKAYSGGPGPGKNRKKKYGTREDWESNKEKLYRKGGKVK